MDLKIWEAQIVETGHCKLRITENCGRGLCIYFFVFKDFIDVDHFYNVYSILFACLFLMFWFIDCEACEILVPWPGIKLTPSVLEGKVLTTGPVGKSLHLCSLVVSKSMNQTLSRRKTHQRMKVRNVSNGGDWISSQEGVAILVYKSYLYPYLYSWIWIKYWIVRSCCRLLLSA